MSSESTKIMLIRHGESIGNLEKRFLGQTDLDLSSLGYKQAELVKNYLTDIDIDVIYSSDLIRAYNTVLPISKSKNIPIIKSDNLREIYAGSWQQLEFDELDLKYADAYNVWKNNIGLACCTDGETVLELQNRSYNEILNICNKNLNKVICICSHATVIRTFIAKCLDKGAEEIKDIPWYKNASITTLEFNNGLFNIIESDFCGHLNGLVSSFPANV